MQLFSSPPPPPPPPPIWQTDGPILVAALCCWLIPAVLLVAGLVEHRKVKSPGKKKAVTATGAAVDVDVERRKKAKAAEAAAGKQAWESRKQQIALAAFIFVPHALVANFQSGPTVAEQVTFWVTESYAQLTDGKITPVFQLGVAALFIERMCYTWVHTFSPSFKRFCKTPVGRMMGKKPLDVVLTIFYINKVIQLGTFVGFYFYIIDFQSPFQRGFSWSGVTPLQWVWLVHAIVVGQGFNTAIYRAIGKAGVYYGYRLDEESPWVTGFPFSVVPHPQYFGVCMCCIGVNIFVATPLHIASGWFNLTLVQVLYYVYMGLVEDYL